jgi:hypothetical protein
VAGHALIGARCPTIRQTDGRESCPSLVGGAEEQTLNELYELLPWGDPEDIGEDMPNPEVTPRVLAIAVYSEVVWRRDWATDQLGDEWTDETFITVHDGVRDLADLADQEENDK